MAITEDFKKIEMKAVEVVKEVENFAVNKIHVDFESWFHEYALKNNVPLVWKTAIKLHLKAIGCLKDSALWESGVKHFGCP